MCYHLSRLNIPLYYLQRIEIISCQCDAKDTRGPLAIVPHTAQKSDQMQQLSRSGTWLYVRVSNRWWFGCCVTLGLQTGKLTQSVPSSPCLRRGGVALPVVRMRAGQSH